MNDAGTLGGDRRRWARRHPIATGLCLLVAVILGTVIALPGENSRLNIVVGSAAIGLVFGLLVWLVTWVIDRVRARAAPRSFPGEPGGAAVSVAGTARPSATSSVWSAPPALDGSAFEATAHVPLPQPPVADPKATGRSDGPAAPETSAPTSSARTRRAGRSSSSASGTRGATPSAAPRSRRSSAIQTFIGMKAVHHKADRGIVMTTAEVSRPAIQLAVEHDIVLIDGDDMVKALNLMGSR